jgi:hypothetical protein
MSESAAVEIQIQQIKKLSRKREKSALTGGKSRNAKNAAAPPSVLTAGKSHNAKSAAAAPFALTAGSSRDARIVSEPVSTAGSSRDARIVASLVQCPKRMASAVAEPYHVKQLKRQTEAHYPKMISLHRIDLNLTMA